mgnify:FL=1
MLGDSLYCLLALTRKQINTDDRGGVLLKFYVKLGMQLSSVLLTILLICFVDLEAQRPDSIVVDSTQAFPQVFLMDELTVSPAQKLITVGGVGVLELSVDSISGLPVPTLEQALRRSPLVRVRRNSRGEAQPSLRGGRDRQVAVFMDGIPLTLGWDHRTDLSIIPLTSAESVSVIRGLSSVLYGPNVLAGVIEIDVSGGVLQDRSVKPVSVSLGLDHLGTKVIGSSGEKLFDLSNGTLFLKLGVGSRDRPGFSIPEFGDHPIGRTGMLYGDGNLRLNSDSKHVDAFISTKYSGNAGEWVSIVASGSDLERGVAPEIHEKDPRLWRYPDQKRGVVIVSSGTSRRQTSFGFGEVEFSAGLDRGAFDIQQFRTARYDHEIGRENGRDQTITLRSSGKHSVGAKSEYSAAFTYADIAHSEGVSKTAGFRENFLFKKPSVYSMNNYRQRIWSIGNEIDRTFNSLLGWDESEATVVSVGLTADGADTPESGDKPALQPLRDWGARLGFSSYLPSSGIRLHGGLSRRARFPSLRELYSDALGRFLANPELKAEKLLGSELGFTWAPSSLNLQAVGFYQVLYDAIVRVNVDTFAGKKRQRVNKDKIESRGVEIVTIGELGRFHYAGDLTLQSVWQYGSSGPVQPEYEPHVFGRASVSTQLFREFILEAEYRYKGHQFCLDPEVGLQQLRPTNDVGFKLRRLFQLKDGKRLNNLDSSIAVSNLGNSLIFDQCGLPQPGRTVELQIRLF